jgi:hypothetical protein
LIGLHAFNEHAYRLAITVSRVSRSLSQGRENSDRQRPGPGPCCTFRSERGSSQRHDDGDDAVCRQIAADIESQIFVLHASHKTVASRISVFFVVECHPSWCDKIRLICLVYMEKVLATGHSCTYLLVTGAIFVDITWARATRAGESRISISSSAVREPISGRYAWTPRELCEKSNRN